MLNGLSGYCVRFFGNSFRCVFTLRTVHPNETDLIVYLLVPFRLGKRTPGTDWIYNHSKAKRINEFFRGVGSAFLLRFGEPPIVVPEFMFVQIKKKRIKLSQFNL